MIMKRGIFRKILLGHEDVVSGKPFVSFHSVMILSNHNEKLRISKFYGKIFTSCS